MMEHVSVLLEALQLEQAAASLLPKAGTVCQVSQRACTQAQGHTASCHTTMADGRPPLLGSCSCRPAHAQRPVCRAIEEASRPEQVAVAVASRAAATEAEISAAEEACAQLQQQCRCVF